MPDYRVIAICDCETCFGTGQVTVTYENNVISSSCPTCRGTGIHRREAYLADALRSLGINPQPQTVRRSP